MAGCMLTCPPHRKLTCKLTQKDPKAIANKQSALDGLEQLDNPGTAAGPTFQPSTATADRAKINEYIGQILATYTPRPQLTGSSDKSVFVNPKKGQEYFVITMRRAEAWGKAMHTMPATVDLRTPPKTPMFDYTTGPLEADGRPPAAITQQPAPTYAFPPYPHMYPPMNYMPQYGFQGAGITHPHPHPVVPPVGGLGGVGQDSSAANTPRNSQPESSPAPSDTEGKDGIRCFLKYARVDPDSSAVWMA
ncbi:hypothetical protein PGT21_022987 [Puccinia graminis f. sp. tritici]|uniref:Uncharacterized protein n=1 Tax=Puccinia graminis f. sp. tritici TaxID=56615 RepID=A0A5B0QPB6_PUCGR|nr:hypothetical protein PGT21_022987 [Puccinia graminis f. sp. tritici]